jgi:hypothetical protein
MGQMLTLEHASYFGIKVINIFIIARMIDYIINSTDVTAAAFCVSGM